MGRPVVGIYATPAPADWGPWRERPSVVAPAALGAAVQHAGGVVVLLAPGEDPGLEELLATLDALIVFDDADELSALRDLAAAHGLQLLVLDAEQITPHATLEDCARAIAELRLGAG
jgi:hypothetical protein